MQNEVEMIRDLLRAGQNPNEANEGGLTPLLVACQQGSLTASKLLVDAGADVNHQDESGFTPLMEAAILGYDRIAQYLLEHGADASLKNSDGETARDLALKEEHHDLAALLKRKKDKARQEKEEAAPEPQESKATPEALAIPPIPNVVEFPQENRIQETTENPDQEIEATEPPPLPEYSKQPIRFVDDLAPVLEDEKYAGPGLICRTCKEQIAPEDIWCAHCKAPIIRRYCGGCHELIPDNAANCPYCSSSKVHRFRYFRHLEQIVGGAAILGVLLFVLGVYNPQDGSSYAKKLAQQRSEQQEQKIIAAEEISKKQNQERQVRGTKSRPATTPAVVRVVPSEAKETDIVQAEQIAKPERIPTVERIESTPEEAPRETETTSRNRDSISQAGEPVVEPEPRITEQKKEVIVKPEETRTIEEREGRGTIQRAERLNQEGFRLMKNGRYAEAIPVLAKAVRSFPPGEKNLTYAYALYNLGRSLRLVGRADLAIPILEERMKFANQRHIVARELAQAREELEGGPEPIDNIRYR